MKKRFRIPVPVPHAAIWLNGCLGELVHVFTGRRPTMTRDKAREFSQRFWTVSADKAKAQLEWRSKISLQNGLRLAVEDWRGRRPPPTPGPELTRDRILKTIPLAVAIGLVIEGLARIGCWWVFDPWWVVLLIVVLGFGGVLGGASLITASRSRWIQFLAGGLLGFVGELANALWLDLWRISPTFIGWLPQNDWIISLALGLPLGFVPVIINSAVCGLYRRSLRRGCGRSKKGGSVTTHHNKPKQRQHGVRVRLREGVHRRRESLLRFFRPRPIKESDFKTLNPFKIFRTVLTLIWNTFARVLHSTEACVLGSTFFLLLVWGTHGELDTSLAIFWDRYVGPGKDPPPADRIIPGVPWDQELISWMAGIALVVFVPWLLIKVFYTHDRIGYRLRHYGLRLPWGRWKFALISAAILFFGSLPMVYVGAHTKMIQDVYPIYRGGFDSAWRFAGYELCYLMFFIAIEFIFRGYLLFGAVRSRQRNPSASANGIIGLPPYGYFGLLISMLSYTAWHLGKPWPEIYSTLLWGVAAGVVVLVTRSVWLVIIVHWLLNVVMDLVLWKQWFSQSLLQRLN
jgi:membrane protease YdiL (CAAX protease family)